ncbi:MipA/OmpV family protein [Parvularcula lutaonensis]|uniref:MipA/OmpV family protein n=1 Tax=Parvularcula lutaonensis TaxID=491923 RepID=A0ABV7MCE8_9PROT|nr:MipA/OmpV family protein [Parvularcula lutaonensis]GGY39811.1 putative outer membrane protein YiaT [Parvularcula lutaonensis]
MYRKYLGLLAGAASIGALAHAQTPEEIEQYKKMTIFQLGAAVAVNNEPYRNFNGGDPNKLVVPFYVYNKNNLTLAGPNISYRFWRPLDVQISAEGKYRFQNYEEDDSPFLEGMGDRNGTFEVGLKAQKRYNRLRLQAEGFVDAAGQHDGYELTARATLEVGNGRMISFRPLVGVSYQSENLIQYYYGITNAEARVNQAVGDGTFMDRPAYFADGGAVTPFAGAQVRVRLSRRLAFQGQVKSAFLPDGITDSAIVEKDNRTSAFFGLSYALSGPGVKPGQWL